MFDIADMRHQNTYLERDEEVSRRSEESSLFKVILPPADSLHKDEGREV